MLVGYQTAIAMHTLALECTGHVVCPCATPSQGRTYMTLLGTQQPRHPTEDCYVGTNQHGPAVEGGEGVLRRPEAGGELVVEVPHVIVIGGVSNLPSLRETSRDHPQSRLTPRFRSSVRIHEKKMIICRRRCVSSRILAWSSVSAFVALGFCVHWSACGPFVQHTEQVPIWFCRNPPCLLVLPTT